MFNRSSPRKATTVDGAARERGSYLSIVREAVPGVTAVVRRYAPRAYNVFTPHKSCRSEMRVGQAAAGVTIDHPKNVFGF